MGKKLSFLPTSPILTILWFSLLRAWFCSGLTICSSSGAGNLLGRCGGLGRLAIGEGVATATAGLAGGTWRRTTGHGGNDELILALRQAEEEVEDEVFGPFLAEHGSEEAGGRIALGRVGVVSLLAVEDGLL